MHRYDAIVVGTGGVGSAALLCLALRGKSALGLDRFPPGHDRGSSHGATRMIRQAYFEHPDYVPLVLRAYELWAELEARRGDALFRQTGLLQLGPADGAVYRGVLASAERHSLAVDQLTAAEVRERYPNLRPDDAMVGLFERRAGYLSVETCIVAQLEEAVRSGAELKTGESVLSWRADGSGYLVETDCDVYRADRLIVTAGPWAGQLLADLNLPLVVVRKPQYWFAADSPHWQVDRGATAFLFETPAGMFYGFPQIDERGVKVAEHSGGPTVDDPLQVDREVDAADQQRVEAFCERYLVGMTTRRTHHAVCMYTMAPDADFIVDRHPAHPGVVFAAGLSGHGFKFTPVLGQALVDLAIEGRTTLPVDFLGAQRDRLRNG